ncbi:tetratricopeptide repeat protein [Calidifontibacillus erzurumensis]|uniref:Tetratricopeptide repeat protein n=1 Tax=Calidifontibacillus erzurumensis TaxID=2741433 RepID=A0A8J8KCS6_9BACI|nr:tetratricopeptide repeat protein [Calidifontibacillus erzurumensis]NSL52283.1 tetratricopeptide repeat protein [Calidifontibacillus erzurumensis]
MNEKLQEAIELVNTGEVEKGLTIVKKLVKDADDEQKLQIAELYFKWGFLDEAKALFSKLLRLYPNEGLLYIYLAEIAIDQDQEEEAIQLLEKIKKDDPAYLQSLVLMADMFQMQGLDEAAEQKLLQAKKLAPNEAIIDLGLGQFYASIGEYNKAIPFFEKLIEVNAELENTNVNLLLAEAYVHTGRFEDALECYAEGLKEQIELNSLFNFGFVAYQLERYELAIAKWNEVKVLDPDYIPVYLYMAKAYEQIGSLKESYETAEEGLKHDPDYKELLVFAAKMAMKLEKHEKVEDYLKKAIAIDPGYIEALTLLGSYYLFHEEYDEVVSLYEQAIEMDEYDPQFEWDLAEAKKQLDRYKDALNHYESAYTSFKENIQFLRDFAYFLLELGDRKRAKEMFVRILELDPSNSDIEEELLRLEEW